MSRRTISNSSYQLDCDGNPPWADEGDHFRPDPAEYVSYLIDGSPFERLLWLEIRRIEQHTHMTQWQIGVFECYLRGLSIRDTCAIYRRSPATIHQHLQAAVEKAETFPHRGLLTCMIETLGWPTVRECLARRLGAKIKRRRYRTDA